MWIRPAICLLAVALTVSAVRAQGIGALGVGMTPAHFPRHGAREVEGMFRLGRELGSIGVFIYQWSQPDLRSVARDVLGRAAKDKLVPMVGLSPTVLAGARGELDVPDAVRKVAGRRLSFAEREVQQAFVDDALALARLAPAYLCLATEINMLAFRDIKEYVAFAQAYKTAYREIKKVAPRTQVFVSFQWDFFHVMRRREPDRIGEHARLIALFEPELDVVALTSYPSAHMRSPDDVPADYYSRALDYVGGKPVVVMEIGWPSGGTGSEAAQAAFVRRLPALMREARPKVLAWSLLHDVVHPDMGSDLTTTGLLTAEGRAKSSFSLFKALRKP